MADKIMIPVSESALKKCPVAYNFFMSGVYKKGDFLAELVQDFFASRGMDGVVRSPEELRVYRRLIGTSTGGSNLSAPTPEVELKPRRNRKDKPFSKSKSSNKKKQIEPEPGADPVAVIKAETPASKSKPEPEPEPKPQKSLTNEDIGFVSKTIEEMEAEGNQSAENGSGEDGLVMSDKDMYASLGIEMPDIF